MATSRESNKKVVESISTLFSALLAVTGTFSQNLTTLAMDKEYKLKRARRKEARGKKIECEVCARRGMEGAHSARMLPKYFGC